MKKIISIFLCFVFTSLNISFAEMIEDELADKLDKNLKISDFKSETIEDELIQKLNPNLKIKNPNKYIIVDDFALKIDKKHLENTSPKTLAKATSNDYEVILAPLKNYSTRKLVVGEKLSFALLKDVEIDNVLYSKGTLIQAQVETITQNSSYGVPADLIVGNFALPNQTILNGKLELQGANRALWVYPCTYVFMPFFFMGSLFIPIRGGHAKLNSNKTYKIEI